MSHISQYISDEITRELSACGNICQRADSAEEIGLQIFLRLSLIVELLT